MSELSTMRRSYVHAPLLESDVPSDPHAFFDRWMDDAKNLLEPNAMTLASVDANGQPQVRTVLLRAHDTRGFVFYTNYGSHKARELEAHPRASLLFFWSELSRQVRVSGIASRVATEESEAYFASRPRGHQLGAWASAQSEAIASRDVIAAQMDALEARFPGVVPRPPHWGGYRISAETFEFWQGQENRLHDRLFYGRHGGAWRRERLSP
jgi:pyridoxamine 5'-phosphate oxidase